MLGLLIVLIVIGVALNFVPMEPRIRTIAVAVVAVVALVVLLKYVGVGLG